MSTSEGEAPFDLTQLVLKHKKNFEQNLPNTPGKESQRVLNFIKHVMPHIQEQLLKKPVITKTVAVRSEQEILGQSGKRVRPEAVRRLRGLLQGKNNPMLRQDTVTVTRTTREIESPVEVLNMHIVIEATPNLLVSSLSDYKKVQLVDLFAVLNYLLTITPEAINTQLPNSQLKAINVNLHILMQTADGAGVNSFSVKDLAQAQEIVIKSLADSVRSRTQVDQPRVLLTAELIELAKLSSKLFRIENEHPDEANSYFLLLDAFYRGELRTALSIDQPHLTFLSGTNALFPGQETLGEND